MFTDCLEVEENLKMSKNLSNQDTDGEIKDTSKLVGPYKQNGRVPIPRKPSPGIQKDDWPHVGAHGPIGLFSEDYNLRRPGTVEDNFKKEFSAPMYDEYEEEYLRDVPEELAME